MTSADQHAITGRHLILYDGVCGLCNRVVQLFLHLDREGQLRYTPLENSLAAEILARFPPAPNEPEGVLLVTDALTPNERLFRRFNAITETLRHLPQPWPTLAAVLRLTPRPLHEWAYGLIARSRYRLFGRLDTCPIPTPAQRSRILGMGSS